MPELLTKIKDAVNRNKNRFGHMGSRLAMGAGIAGVALVSSAAAVDVNWSPIANMLDGLGTQLFPSLLGLVVAAVPIIIMLAVVGFVMGFFDRILSVLGKLG